MEVGGLKMNTRHKGRKNELEAKKLLEQAEWTVLMVENPKQWNKGVDYFGLFDLIAIKGPYKKFIQIKTNRVPPFKKYNDWGKKHANEYDSVEVWVRIDRQGWKTYLVHNKSEGISINSIKDLK